MNQNLIQAYKSTNYRVLTEPEFSFRVGEPSATLDDVLRSHGVTSASFITAWNPFSKELELKDNRLRNQALVKRANALGLALVDGFGAWPDDPYKGEESYLLIGVSREDAVALAKEFEQNAIVFAKLGNPVELVITVDLEGDQ